MTPDQVDKSIQVARHRQDHATANGIKEQGVDDRPPIDKNIEGALGEGAVAAWLGVFDTWFAHMMQSGPESGQPDVGLFHVRSCRPGRGLIFKPSIDPPDGAFVLVHVGGDRSTSIIGWAFGFEIQQGRYWRSEWRRPAWCLPAHKTYGLQSARAWHEWKHEQKETDQAVAS